VCGRFTLTANPKAVAEHFELDEMPVLAPRFNIAPGQEVATVAESEEGRRITPRRWGLIPRWAENPGVGARMINARSETVAERPAYRSALRHRRCLIPADGFYEWAAGPSPRQPHYIRLPDHSLFAMAGLWERWEPKEGADPIESCTVLTTEANRVVGALHARMPVILPREDWRTWLDPEIREPGALTGLFAAWPDAETACEPVGLAVNDTRVEGPECIAAIEAPVQGQLF